MTIHKTLTIFLMILPGFQIAAMQQPDLRQQLINAAKAGNVERVEELMLTGTPVAPEALFYSTVAGNYDVVKTIFECGVDPESPANPNQRFSDLTLFMNLVLNKVLQPQIKEKLIKLYVKHGAEIELRPPPRLSPRIDVVRTLEPNTLKLLLELGADVNVQNAEGVTPLQRLSWADTFPLCPPKKRGEEKEIKKKAELLIQYKADVNLENQDGKTSLMIAVLCHNRPVAELLLKNGADVNLKDVNGETCLTMAVPWRGNRTFVEFLLKYNADINLQNNEGETGLMKAARNGNKDIVECLLKYNANVDLKSTIGKSALDYAKDQPRILKLLMPNPIDKLFKKAMEFVSLGS